MQLDICHFLICIYDLLCGVNFTEATFDAS